MYRGRDLPRLMNRTLRLFFRGDQTHTALHNGTFLSGDQVTFVEDAGDTLHTQRNALDSAWVFDVGVDYLNGTQPVRVLAEGRDTSATIDSALADADVSDFQNDGDNEITGMHMCDGDATTAGILGAKVPSRSRAVGGCSAPSSTAQRDVGDRARRRATTMTADG